MSSKTVQTSFKYWLSPYLLRRKKVFKMAEFDDNQLNRMAKKIAISDGVPESAFKTSGFVSKKIIIDDKYASKFAEAIEKARKLLSNDDEQGGMQ